MLYPPENVDRYNCSHCSHRTASCFQLDHHVQRNHKNVYASELFQAVVEPEQFSCVRCDHNSHYQLKLYEHYQQAHDLRTEHNENMSFCEEFVGYSCDYCKYRADSSLCLAKHHILCRKVPPSGVPRNATEDAESLDVNRARTSKGFGAVELNMSGPDSLIFGTINFLKCNHCSYLAKYGSALKRHLLTHATNEEINWLQCSHCSYRAKEKSALKSHMLRHATNDEINWFQCSHCSYRTKRKSALKSHMLQYAKNEEIVWSRCNHCSYQTKRKPNLTRHMLQHVKKEVINWFQCSLCEYRAKHKSDLKPHMLRHAKEEEIDWFQCSICPYRAKRKSHLKRHTLQHAKTATGEISYVAPSTFVRR